MPDSRIEAALSRAWRESGCERCVSRVNGAGCADCHPHGSSRRIVLMLEATIRTLTREKEEAEAMCAVLAGLFGDECPGSMEMGVDDDTCRAMATEHGECPYPDDQAKSATACLIHYARTTVRKEADDA